MINLAVILGAVADIGLAGIVFGAWKVKRKFDEFNKSMNGMFGVRR